MSAVTEWLEHSFAPRMSKVNNNVWVLTLKDSIMQILPFIFLGSVFVLLSVARDYATWLPDFQVPFGWTMGLVSLFVAFLIPFNLMEKKRLRKQRLIAGLSSVSLFLIIITPEVVADGKPGFGNSALGAGGMFVAITAALFTGWVMSMFGRFSFFKEGSALPDFVRAWFDAMLPIAVVVLTGWAVVDLLTFDLYNTIVTALMPLQKVMQTPWGFAFWMFLHCALYSMGISGWVLEPIQKPIFLAAVTANMAGTATNVVTAETIYSAYLWIGGVGATLPLVLMLARSRSTRLRALGRASLVPAAFNINEPVVFGAVVWNPMLMIPMWLQGLILPIVVWLFTKVIPLAPVPTRLFDLWYVPYPISTWLTTSSARAIVLAVVVFVVAASLWYPFFRAYEKQTVAAEKAETTETAAS
ncbi:PTS sugar transporter subunit IIC [Streptomyces sp. Inha503]|uniref:PTS sugar transporter subunit IIC n=1 Tax=Streptomyces sp. Inha503 TaxID=3383314 RepID=UPI0039A16340